MGYLDTELSETMRVVVDEASPAELREMAHDDPERAVLDHYKEVGFWWADWIHDPHTGERVPYEVFPARDRLANASDRGTFLLED